MSETALSEDVLSEMRRAAGLSTHAQAPWLDHGTYSWVDFEAEIGKGTVVFPGAYIGPGVKIGENCVIGPNAAIGQPGFGYERQEDGRQLYRHHLHGVLIADDVHIGANTCIDAGRWRPTSIGRGTRIDNLVHIAHNVVIGEDCLIIATSQISGSVVIGDRTQVSPSASIRDNLEIGEDVLVGLGAVVVKPVASGDTVMGVPARSVHERR